MFYESVNTTITGGTFIDYSSHVHSSHVHGATIGGFERLQQAVAPNAFHDAGHIVDPPKCHPNTRVAVINKIMDWILGRGVDDQNTVILWFYGPAGAGKSAIAKKIAELCDLEKRLLASFFFSRADSTRSNATSLISTIAYQIAINLPQTRGKVVAAIERDPLIVTRSLEAQVVALVVDPLRELLDAGHSDFLSSQRLVIVDGLDECKDSAVQCKILDTISLLFRKYHLPLLILIASRPERHLVHSFNCGSLHEFHTTLALDDTYQPDDDIRLFLSDNLQQIKDTHPMKGYLDPSWPSINILNTLVKRSSGQFIYASTVVKYVTSLHHQPADRLNVVLGIQPPRYAREMPFGELDTLYRHILSTVEDTDMVLLILGFLLSRQSVYLRPQDIDKFFLLSQGDVDILLGYLSSVITISNTQPYIQILHASLGDFLCDAARSNEFYIDLSSIHTRCMLLCFQHIKQCMSTYFPSKEAAAYLYLTDTISNIHDHGAHIDYAVDNLVWHCENTPLSASLQLHEEIINFPLYPPDSCFPHTSSMKPGWSLFFYVPKFLQFIKTLPFDGIDEIYKQKLAVVLEFFVSKLPIYYSSSQMTLLVTLLDFPPDWFQDLYESQINLAVPLPSRLKMMDHDVLHLWNFAYVPKQNQSIFQDFLNSGHPQALDGQRYATATLACLNIIFKDYQALVSCLSWLGQRSHTLRLAMEQHSQQHRTDLPAGTDWEQDVQFYWHLRIYLLTQTPQKMSQTPKGNSLLYKVYYEFQDKRVDDSIRSTHLQFLLEKSAHSNGILKFAHHRVFRFRYLNRRHPTYMKKAIFALAKYIQRVTGETAEVKACEAIWGRQRWFTAN